MDKIRGVCIFHCQCQLDSNIYFYMIEVHIKCMCESDRCYFRTIHWLFHINKMDFGMFVRWHVLLSRQRRENQLKAQNIIKYMLIIISEVQGWAGRQTQRGHINNHRIKLTGPRGLLKGRRREGNSVTLELFGSFSSVLLFEFNSSSLSSAPFCDL